MTTQTPKTGEEYYQDKLDGENFDIVLFHDGNVSGYVEKPIQAVDGTNDKIEVKGDIRNFLSVGDPINIDGSNSNDSPSSNSDNYGVTALDYDFETERTVITLDADVTDDTPYGNAVFGLLPADENWVRGDNLVDTDDLPDITTEPGDGNYVRQTASFSSNSVNDNWRLETDSDVVFDVDGTTGRVDAGAVIVNYTSDTTGDSSANDHILFTFDLSQDYLLENTDQVTVNASTINNELR